VPKSFIYGGMLFDPKLWRRTNVRTSRGGDERPSSNSILWSLDFGRKFWLTVEMRKGTMMLRSSGGPTRER
jgi:hypothetical protein